LQGDALAEVLLNMDFHVTPIVVRHWYRDLEEPVARDDQDDGERVLRDDALLRKADGAHRLAQYPSFGQDSTLVPFCPDWR
jgi:hypothetical protein